MPRNELDPLDRLKREERALKILVALASDVCNGRGNDRLIARYLDELALGGNTDQVRATIRRLEDVGALRTEAVERDIVMTLTELGQRIATGRERVEGVAWLLPD